MLQTKYPYVDSLVHELANEIKTVLGNDFKGLYVFGSLVIGDFDSERSDIDMLAMVEDDISKQQLAKLKVMHVHFVKRHTNWDDRIEVAYVSKKGMRNFKVAACQIARISPGEPLHFREMDINWLMDWYMVLRYGQTVIGPPPNEFIPDISQQEFITSLRNYSTIWIQNAKEANHVGYQSYIILSLCRSLYVYEYGEQVSKIKAAEWAINQYPDWSNLIQKALEWKGSPNKSPSPETRIQTEEFVSFVITEAEK